MSDDQPDPIREIRTELINHADPIVRQAYEYIVDLELSEATLKAKVERLERYLFAARAGVTTLESELEAVSASCDAYAEEVGRLAHKLAALAGEGDEHE